MRQFFKRAMQAAAYAPWLTRERLLCAGAVCAFMTIGLFVLDAAVHANLNLTDGGGEHLGRDFYDFWSNAVLAAAGRPDAAYAVGIGHSVDQTLTYPPIMMLLCWPFAHLPYAASLLVWTGLGVALCVWSLSRLVGCEMALLAAIGAPAAFTNLVIGQNGYYSAVLLVLGIALVERRPVRAGILLGTLCYKPQLAILLPVALAAGGYWRALGAAAGWVVLLVTASVIVFGPAAWIGFFHRLVLQRQLMEVRVVAWSWMPTVFAMMRLFGAGLVAAYVAQAASAIAAAVAVTVLWRRGCPLAIKAAGLAVGVFLVTPHAWDYDTVVLVFAAAWLANEAVRTGFRPWEKLAVLALLTLPDLSLGPAKLLGLQTAPVLLWLTMAVLLRRALPPLKQETLRIVPRRPVSGFT